jgi:hypothetical protein
MLNFPLSEEWPPHPSVSQETTEARPPRARHIVIEEKDVLGDPLIGEHKQRG